jgi:C1A family cysteine protease
MMLPIMRWISRKTTRMSKPALIGLLSGTLAVASLLFSITSLSQDKPSQRLASISTEDRVLIDSGGLPARFDIRNLASLTPVKEQGSTGGCWAFASLAALETHLAFRKSRYVELSENNLMTQLSRTYDESFDRDADGGGDDLMSVGYYAAWRGPALAKDDPFPETKMAKDMILRPGIRPSFHVQEVLLLPERRDPLDNDLIKRSILNYGAVSASMWKGSDETFGPYYNEETFAWYYDRAVVNKGGNGHAVTIVGWDDSFPKASFKILPPGDGAFIVRNTKGPLWGQKQRKKNLGGYFYVSYYDRMFLNKLDSLIGNHVFSRVDEASPYDRLYQHDLLGYNHPLKPAGTAQMVSFANVFKATGRYGELLKAVSFYTLAEGTRYEISVVTGFSKASSLSSGILAATGVLDLPGYYTIDFAEPIRLAPNTRFAVVVKQTAASTPVIAADSALGHKVKRSVSRPGESYILDGNWTDLYSTHPNTNVCLKAFTVNLPAPPEKAFSVAAMKRDLEYALEKIRAVHPVVRDKGFSRLQKTVIDSVRQKTASPIAREEFYLHMLRIFAMMGDGHTNLRGQTDEIRYLDLPVDWLMRDGIVVAVNAGVIRKGDQVASIGGANQEKLLQLFGAIIPHENEYRVRENAPRMLQLESHLSFLGLINPDSTIDVEIVRDGAPKIYRIPLTESAHSIPQQAGVPMDWRIEKSNNLGYFRFDSFPSRDVKLPLATEIGKFFEAVRKEAVSNVAFDWRYNPGGNTPILGDILSYVQACPSFVAGFGMITKKPKPELFGGNLYVMTSHKTFSSAVVSTTVLSDSGLARTLGEPTGENPDFNRHGQGGDGNLPVSGWHYMLVSGKSDRPRPNYSETAVKLDIPVFTSTSDLIAGRDIQLERLRELVAGRNWRYALSCVDITRETEWLSVERGAGFFFDAIKKTIILDRDPASVKRAYFTDTATSAETHETVMQNGRLGIPATLKPGVAYHLVFEVDSSSIGFLSTVLAQSEQTLDPQPIHIHSFSYVERFHYFVITFKEPIKKLNPEGITVTDQQGRSLGTVSISVAMASPATLVIRPTEPVTPENPCVITLPAGAFVLESGATNTSVLRLGNYSYSKKAPS